MEHERHIEAVRIGLGAVPFSQAWAEGQAWSWEEVIAAASDPPAHAPAGAAREAPNAGAARWSGLSDADWECARPLLAAAKRRGRPPADDRQTLDGILHVLRAGCRWQDLPRRYGTAVTCWRRYQRWRADGTWERLCRALPALVDF